MSRRLSSPDLALAPHELGPRWRAPDPRTAEQLEQAREEAYARGRADGVAEARAAADAAAGRAAQGLRAALAAQLAELRQVAEVLSSETVELALAAAEAVLGREPADGGAALAARLHAALESVDDAPLTVSVAPDEVAVVAAALASEPGVSVVGLASLQPGEARVQGRWASLDLTRAALRSAVREVVAEWVPAGGPR